jgi:hypothetical protein
MLVPLILAFIASVLMVFGVTRFFRFWMRSDSAPSRDRLEKDTKLMDASALTDEERGMLRERMKQKLRQELEREP